MKYLRNLLAALVMFALLPLANSASAQVVVYQHGRQVRVYQRSPRPTFQITTRTYGTTMSARERAHQANLARLSQERAHQAYLARLAAERSGRIDLMRVEQRRQMRQRMLESYHARLARER